MNPKLISRLEKIEVALGVGDPCFMCEGNAGGAREFHAYLKARGVTLRPPSPRDVMPRTCSVCGRAYKTNVTGYSAAERVQYAAAMDAVAAFWRGEAGREESHKLLKGFLELARGRDAGNIGEHYAGALAAYEAWVRDYYNRPEVLDLMRKHFARKKLVGV